MKVEVCLEFASETRRPPVAPQSCERGHRGLRVASMERWNSAVRARFDCPSAHRGSLCIPPKQGPSQHNTSGHQSPTNLTNVPRIRSLHQLTGSTKSLPSKSCFFDPCCPRTIPSRPKKSQPRKLMVRRTVRSMISSCSEGSIPRGTGASGFQPRGERVQYLPSLNLPRPLSDNRGRGSKVEIFENCSSGRWCLAPFVPSTAVPPPGRIRAREVAMASDLGTAGAAQRWPQQNRWIGPPRCGRRR